MRSENNGQTVRHIPVYSNTSCLKDGCIKRLHNPRARIRQGKHTTKNIEHTIKLCKFTHIFPAKVCAHSSTLHQNLKKPIELSNTSSTTWPNLIWLVGGPVEAKNSHPDIKQSLWITKRKMTRQTLKSKVLWTNA